MTFRGSRTRHRRGAEWLTAAIKPADDYEVHNFVRHGRQRTDSCDLVLKRWDGEHVVEIEEQRHLQTPNTVRATLVSATDGLAGRERLNQSEYEHMDRTGNSRQRVGTAEQERRNARMDGDDGASG